MAILATLASSGSVAAGWVAVGASGTILRSADGLSWSASASPTTETLHGVNFNGTNTWAAVGQRGTIVTSEDTENWNQQVSGNTDALWGAVFAGGQWIVSGGRGRIVSSADAVNWGSVNDIFSFTLYDIAYDGSSLYTIAGDSSAITTVLTSADAVTWAQKAPQPNNGEGLYGIAFGQAIWVAVGDRGTILTSTDPTSRTWTEQVSGSNTNLRDIVYNGAGLYVVVGEEGLILTSNDTINWSSQTGATREDLGGIEYDGNGQYIAVGDNGVIQTSSNAINWTPVGSPTTRRLYDVVSARLPQSIDFPVQNPLFQDFTAGTTYPLTPAATASSGLPVSYAVVTAGACSINATTITMIAPGECQIEASQPGNATYLPATSVTQSILQLTVPPGGTPTNPGLIFDPQDAEPFVPGGTFALNPPASTTQTPTDPQPPLGYASSTPSICSIALQGSITVTMLDVGTCTIVTGSAPTSVYSLGGPIAASIEILPRAQSISFGAQSDQDFLQNGTFLLSPPASASSGLPVAYASLSPSVCSAAATTITMLLAGNCVIEASQGGDRTWERADSVRQTIAISNAPVTATAVPTMSAYGLVITGMGLYLLSAVRIRRT